jgi:uncharacterized protein (TIGR02145 family)
MHDVRSALLVLAALALLATAVSCSRSDRLLDEQGFVYRTVRIGDREWMASNLRLDVGQGSYCYGDDPDRCAEMGRLYTWEAAREADERVKGWHLPSRTEWEELIRRCGADSTAYDALVSDALGFHPQWAGVRVAAGDYRAGDVTGVSYWSSTVADTNQAYAWAMAILGHLRTISPHDYPKENACSVRLVKDR